MIFCSTFVILVFAASIERSSPATSRLCADAEILKNKFPQLSDCILTWVKRIPVNVDEYCKTSTDLVDFCSRLDKYKNESRDSRCAYFRSNIDHWVECMAYFSFKEADCKAGSKCPKIPLYDAIPNCNKKKELAEYQSCMESGTTLSLFRNNYFGVPAYWIAIIVGLCLTLVTLLVLYKSVKSRRKLNIDSRKDSEKDQRRDSKKDRVKSQKEDQEQDEEKAEMEDEKMDQDENQEKDQKDGKKKDHKKRSRKKHHKKWSRKKHHKKGSPNKDHKKGEKTDEDKKRTAKKDRKKDRKNDHKKSPKKDHKKRSRKKNQIKDKKQRSQKKLERVAGTNSANDHDVRLAEPKV